MWLMIGFEITVESEPEKDVFIDGCKNITSVTTMIPTTEFLIQEKVANKK